MKISFFCKTNKPDSLQLVDFYRQDIEALQELDPHLVIATKWRQIDWHADIIFVWWWTYAFIPVLIILDVLFINDALSVFQHVGLMLIYLYLKMNMKL